MSKPNQDDSIRKIIEKGLEIIYVAEQVGDFAAAIKTLELLLNFSEKVIAIRTKAERSNEDEQFKTT